MTFDEARELFSRVDPDSNDTLVQSVITTYCAQAEVLKAHWRIGGETAEAAPPNPAIAGRRYISDANMAARLMREVKRGADAAERSEALVRAHVVPRPGDCAVTQQQMSDILAELDVRRDRKTIRRWEGYLSTGGREGTQPPEGYTLQTRLTLQSATAWAQRFAAQEKSKLNVKVSLERLTGGRQ